PGVLHRAAYPPQYKDQLLSMEQYKDAPGLTTESIDFFWVPSDPGGSPLLAPAYIQVCGLDPLRDE
ncbi:hypothetical protein DFH07DRAFT_696596, partial [Mycena maculata]